MRNNIETRRCRHYIVLHATGLPRCKNNLYFCSKISPAMDRFDQQTLIEEVLYILEKTGGIDYYHLFKILYFAERSLLAEWGCRLNADDFCALEYGPVPTHLYDAVKELKSGSVHSSLAEMLAEAVEFAGEDAPNVLLAKRRPDMDFLSKACIEELDKSITRHSTQSFRQLKDASHDDAWKEAYHSSGLRAMSTLSIAKAGNADAAMIDYIKEQLEIDDLLK